MTGKYGGVTTKTTKSDAKNFSLNHCNIHRKASVLKRIPEQFQQVLGQAVKIDNFFKSRAL